MSTSTVTDVLPSYACDEWWTPAGDAKGTPVYDASTGEVIGSVSAEGLDLSLIHISEPTRLSLVSRMPSSA